MSVDAAGFFNPVPGGSVPVPALAIWALVAAGACCVLSALKTLLNIGVWVFLALVVIPFAYKYYEKRNRLAAEASAVLARAAAALADINDDAPPPPPPPSAATPAPPVEVRADEAAATAVQRPDIAFPATLF
jgi:hypothetical protein